MSLGELSVLIVFIVAAVSWVSVPLISEYVFGLDDPVISDAGIAMIVGVAMFILPGGANQASGCSIGIPPCNYHGACCCCLGVD